MNILLGFVLFISSSFLNYGEEGSNRKEYRNLAIKRNFSFIEEDRDYFEEIISFVEDQDKDSAYKFLQDQDILRKLFFVKSLQLKILKEMINKDLKNKDIILEFIKSYESNKGELSELSNNLKIENRAVAEIKRGIFKKLLNENYFLENGNIDKILHSKDLFERDFFAIAMQALLNKKMDIVQKAKRKIVSRENLLELETNIAFYKIINGKTKLTQKIIQQYIHKTEYIDLMLCKKNIKNINLIYKILDERDNFIFYHQEWFKIKCLAINYLLEKPNNEEYILAYSILEKTQGDRLTIDQRHEQQWQLGYFALKFEKYNVAIAHFLNYYHDARFASERSRAAYWLSIAYEKEGEKDISYLYKNIASRFYLTFYGQYALEDLHEEDLYKIVKNKINKDNEEVKKHEELFQNNFFFKLGDLFMKRDNELIAVEFFKEFIKEEQDENIRYAGLSSLFDKEFYQRLSSYALKFNTIRIDDKIFPVYENLKDSSIIHSIIKQESGFTGRIVSRKNARGIMQIIPSTAKDIARKLNIKFKKNKLFEKEYNIKLGTTYLDKLAETFKNNQTLILAAYNAGPGSVKKWLARNGDFDKLKTNSEKADWIERISFKETRNYIKIITPNNIIYKIILDLKYRDNK